MFANIYAGRRVLVTGHTGFKGAWLAEWLLALGAEVTGIALPPPTIPTLFEQLGLGSRLRHIECDIRHADDLAAIVAAEKPDCVFHLAAQPLVRLSYRIPAETFGTNVMGTVNLLDAIRRTGRPCAVVVITTDKCYENREWVHAYREEDPLGGHDPYSASKACAEIVASSFGRSFFSNGGGGGVRLATARAGNVIGGGDWAEDRIVPDCIRALRAGDPIPVRNRTATRPWQHVLEPLGGYLLLGSRLLQNDEGAPRNTAFNFGPAVESNRTVLDLVDEICKHWPGSWVDKSEPGALHEAGRLNLATDKAFHMLNWRPVWDFERTVAETVRWYSQAGQVGTANFTRRQIQDYAASAIAMDVAWAKGDSLVQKVLPS